MISDKLPTIDDARKNALDKLEEASEMDITERPRAEMDAIEEFAEILAEKLHEGAGAHNKSVQAEVLADAAKYPTKTSIKEIIQNKIEEIDDNDKKKPLNEVILKRLDEVVVVRSTDMKQNPIYRWHFENGIVETGGGTEGREHFSWFNFRDEYLEATGQDAAKPESGYRDGDEWREFIVDVISDRSREMESYGPRTQAKDALANHIRRSTAYSDVEVAVERDGTYIEIPDESPMDRQMLPQHGVNLSMPHSSSTSMADQVDTFSSWQTPPKKPVGEKEEGDVPDSVMEVWVPGHIVDRVVESENVTHQALQTELNARGLTVDRMRGRVTEHVWVSGTQQKFWVLSPELAEPMTYTPNPRSPAEQLHGGGENRMDSGHDETNDTGLDSVGDI